MSQAHDLLLDIAAEKNGYSIGKPWRFSEFSLAAVVPIIRQVDAVRSYRLISEVGKEVSFRDTGNINKIEVLNKSSYPVLLKSGEVVAGATQSRTFLSSQVIMPQEKLVVDCACVYQTKGIRAGQRVDVEAYSPLDVRRAVRSRYTTNNFDYSSDLQHNVWEGVRSYSRKANTNISHLASFASSHSTGQFSDTRRGRMESLLASASNIDTQTYSTPQDDLAGRIKEYGDKLEKILREVPKTDGQVGIALLTLKGLESLESFNHPDAWKAIREQILKSDSEKVVDVTDSDSVFEYRADKAQAAIRELLTAKYDEKVVVDKGQTSTIALVDKKLVGEVVVLYDQAIHCSFVSKS